MSPCPARPKKKRFAFISTKIVDEEKKLLKKHRYHMIMAVNSHNVLDIENASKEKNTPVIQWRYLQGDNQQWILEPVRP